MSSQHFSSAETVAPYIANLRRSVPGIEVVHDVVELLLAESVPADGRVLVVGAGGGVELQHLAARHEDWSFDGVDPSAEMLALARQTLGPLSNRAQLHQGYVFGAPDGPFDAATCLLTLHFIEPEERLRTLQAIHERLRPGAPLVILQHSIPGGAARRTWLERNAAWGIRASANGFVTSGHLVTGVGVLSGRIGGRGCLG